MVRRLGLGKNNHLTYASLALNPRNKAYNEAKVRTQQKQCVETLGDPGVVKHHHWNTGAKENHQLNPSEPRKRHKKFQGLIDGFSRRL